MKRPEIIASVMVIVILSGCAYAPKSPPTSKSRAKLVAQPMPPARSKPTVATAPVNATKSLNVIAYNSHLLPDIAAKLAGHRSESKYRAQAIGKRLAGFDIVGISEAFDRDYTQALLDSLQLNSEKAFHVVTGPERSGAHLIGSGLLLMSRQPIVESHTMTYSSASRFLTSGFKADGFAAKGALHVRINVGAGADQQIDCFLTHLESRSESARKTQIEEFKQFVAMHSSENLPVVLMGDFNVAADAVPTKDTPYDQMLAALSQNDRRLDDVGATRQTGPWGTSNALAKDGERRIDYLFVSQPKAVAKAYLHPTESHHLPLLDARVPEGSLSDHAAVACRLEYRLVPTVFR